ncbi:MAG: hypothetical protein V2J55_04640 [Candidatus Competibacteraceae bacterium]|jgi:hypothetical protein|nr:hypothetical protein [Candidatus Competibacteraceae bacterium]
MAKTARTFTGRTVELDSPNSLPFLEEQLNLQTISAVNAYRRLFPQVELSFYLISVTALIVARQKQLGTESLEETLAEVRQHMDTERRYFAEQITALLKKLEPASKRDTPSVRYTHPETGPAEYRTPEAAHYLALIKQLEQACQMIHQAYFAGLLSAPEKLAKEQTLQNRVIRLGRFINSATRHRVTQIMRGDTKDKITSSTTESASEDESETDEREEREGQQLLSVVKHAITTEVRSQL